MKVILLEKVAKLGSLGDEVVVKSGYGRNYLIPKGVATFATKENIEIFNQRRSELEKIASELLLAAQEKAEKISGQRIQIEAKQGGEGRLFGAVTSIDIVESANVAGLDITRQEIRMPDGPIRTTGEFTILLNLHADVQTEIIVEVIGIG